MNTLNLCISYQHFIEGLAKDMIGRKMTRLVLLMISLLIIPVVYPMQAHANFSDTIEKSTIHSYSGGTSAFSALAQSPEGVIYLAYVSKFNEEIEIRKWDGNGWTSVTSVTKTMAGASSISGYLDLVVDAENHLHLVFYMADGTDISSPRGIKYGYFNGSGWTFSTVESASDSKGWKTFNNPKIAVDSNGKAHVAYTYFDTNGTRQSQLKYAHNSSGSWQVTSVATKTGTNDWQFLAGIAVSNQNRIYISYQLDSQYKFTSKSQADANFGSPEEVANQVYYSVPVVIDSNDRLYFMYSDISGNAHLATYAEGQWQRKQVYEGSPSRFLYPLDLFVFGTKKYSMMFSIANTYSDYYYFALADDGSQTSVGHQIAKSADDYDYEGVFVADSAGNYIVVVQDGSWSKIFSLSGNSTAFGLSLQDTTPPDPPLITSPAGGAHVNSLKPTYGGTAESGSTVEVFVDGSSIGTTTADGTGNWTLTQPTDLAEGSHTVKATATDAAGNESVESAPVSFTVDVTAPGAPVITSPTDGALVNVKRPTYSGTAEAGSTVKVIVDGSSVGTTTADGTGNWTLTQPTDLADGAHTVKATASDAAGNTSPDSAAVSFTVEVPGPDAPVILTPADGAVVNVKQPTYGGTAEAGVTVEVFVDVLSIGTVTADVYGQWTLTQPTDLTEGAHTVKATATDAEGNEGGESALVSFTVDVTAPGAPVITSPTDGAVLNIRKPTFSGTAEAGSKVQVFLNGSPVGTTTADGAGSWTLTQPADLADGVYLVNANAVDAAGNTSADSAAVSLVVDLTAPAISGAQVSANNAYVDVTFSEGIYGTDQGSGAIDKNDLMLVFTPGNGGASSVEILDVRKPDTASAESAGALVGGETVIRVFLTVSGTENGTGTIEIRPADAASIFDLAGNASSDLETTGPLSLNDTRSVPSTPYNPPESAVENDRDGLDVYVNGQKIEKIARANVKTINGKKVTSVTVDEQQLNDRLDAVEPGYIVAIPVHNGSDSLIAELNARIVSNMAAKEAVLEVQNELGAYILPAREANIEAVLRQFGSGTAPEDVKIRVEMTLLDDSEVATGSSNLQMVAPAVEFRIVAVYGDQEIQINAFSSYVERMITIPDEVERNRITTGVVMLPNGEMGHVPTKVLELDGSQYALINSLTNSVYSVIYHEKMFEDVRSHWAKGYIENMASRLVLKGTSDDRFDPDANITRAEFAAIVVRALGLHSAANGGRTFSDVKSTDWYASQVQIAASYGLMEGYADSTFRANAPITREEAMAVIARAMALAGMDTSLSAERQEQLIAAFADGGSVSRWARQSAALNIHHGIFQGNGGALNPHNPISRAETAAVIQRLLQKADLID